MLPIDNVKACVCATRGYGLVVCPDLLSKHKIGTKKPRRRLTEVFDERTFFHPMQDGQTDQEYAYGFAKCDPQGGCQKTE